MDLDLVDHAVVGKDHQVRMRRSDEEMLDKVAVLGRRAKASLAAASLTRVGRDRSAFDVTAVGDGDRHVFVGDQVFDGEFDAFVDNFGAAFVTKVFLDLFEFLSRSPAAEIVRLQESLRARR